MICTRCLRLRLRLSSPPLSHRLPYSTTRSPPPATSTSAAQPFSTPFTPSPYPSTSPTHPPRSPPQQQQRQEPQSSLKAGTPLKGLALEKNKEVPVAREDGEYPGWLWGLLGKGEGTEGEVEGKGGGDAFSKSAKQRRLASRLSRSSSSTSSSSSSPNSTPLAPEIPLHTQSIDLPAVHDGYRGKDTDLDAMERARGARGEVTGAMRKVRRKGIKEGNFLGGMR